MTASSSIPSSPVSHTPPTSSTTSSTTTTTTPSIPSSSSSSSIPFLRSLANITSNAIPPIPIFPLKITLLKLTCTTIITLYILNQKHLLPKPLSSIVSKALFWPTLPISMMKRFGWWVGTNIDDTVVMGGAPFSILNYPTLLRDKYNVRGVINLCEEYKGPKKDYERLGMEELWLPTTDHFEPEFEDLIKAVEFIQKYKDENDYNMEEGEEDVIDGTGASASTGTGIDDYYNDEEKKEIDQLIPSITKKARRMNTGTGTGIGNGHNKQGGRVYVHCRAGHGRSAAVVFAWLLSQEEDVANVDMKKLNEKLCSMRHVRKSIWKQKNVNEFRSWLHFGGQK